MQVDCTQPSQEKLDYIIEICLDEVIARKPVTMETIAKELTELARAQPKIPLVGTTKKRFNTEHWLGLRSPFINRTLYKQMVTAVEKHFTSPEKHLLVLYVRDLSRYDQQDYSLLYKPRCIPDAITVLQQLYTLEIEERSRFITMLEQQSSLIERLSALDALPPMRYTQICEVIVPASSRK